MRVALILSALAGSTLSAPTLDTRTTKPSAVIRDPGFESGVTPPRTGGNAWNVIDVYDATTYSLTRPGSTINGGKYAFTASLSPDPFSSAGYSGATLVQTMNTRAGQNYSIIMDYKFDSPANNDCSLAIRYPYKDTTGSVTTPSGLSPAGVWYQTGSTFQAVSSADKFYVVFYCWNYASNKISVDNVKIAQHAGNAF